MASRKPLVLAGYSLSALGRTLMFFTGVAPLIVASRILDRFGKGVRTAPRDALIADDARSTHMGRAFAIARSLDTTGAVTGLSMAIFMGIGAHDMTPELFGSMLAMSVPFAWAAALLLWLWVPRLPRQTHAKVYLTWHIPREIRPILAAIAVFALGNSSDAFLVIRAKEVGFDFGEILALFIVFNLLASVVGWLVGQWSDRYGRKRFLVVGWVVYCVCYLVMGAATSSLLFAVTFAVYGAFYGLTDGVEKALLADLLSPRKRGLGYGAFQMTLAVVAIPANILTGYISTKAGLGWALVVSAAFSLAGVVMLIFMLPHLRPWDPAKQDLETMAMGG
jgi:MFS family permease